MIPFGKAIRWGYLATMGGGVFAVVIGGGLWLKLMFSGPRMQHQRNLHTFEAIVPHPPPQSVPYAAETNVSREARDESLGERLARGKTSYGYYCLFCHGEKGDGRGPVGESMMPKPKDLRAREVRLMEDAALMNAMVHGIGHDPVLEGIVPVAHRGALAAYVRQLGLAP